MNLMMFHCAKMIRLLRMAMPRGCLSADAAVLGLIYIASRQAGQGRLRRRRGRFSASYSGYRKFSPARLLRHARCSETQAMPREWLPATRAHISQANSLSKLC